MRALVTGASQGIGRATATRLAREGGEVAIHYHRHRLEAEELAREVSTEGKESFPVGADLGNRAETRGLASVIRERWGSLDALVLNAGVYPRRRFAQLTDADIETCFKVNVFGPMTLTRELLPLLERAPAGRIVVISSVLAFTGSRHGAHYAATKAALVGWARSLSRELAPGITVNVIAPGSVETAILADDSPEVRTDRVRGIPLGRIGTPKEIADVVAFLVSPGASYITGATLHVNGGVRAD
ncbi:MAG: SDR family oxidoreductase [Thermoplasmata archaeon]|nr:SDR family oxidoreductase [Thermoplasmata archaeon]